MRLSAISAPENLQLGPLSRSLRLDQCNASQCSCVVLSRSAGRRACGIRQPSKPPRAVTLYRSLTRQLVLDSVLQADSQSQKGVRIQLRAVGRLPPLAHDAAHVRGADHRHHRRRPLQRLVNAVALAARAGDACARAYTVLSVLLVLSNSAGNLLTNVSPVMAYANSSVPRDGLLATSLAYRDPGPHTAPCRTTDGCKHCSGMPLCCSLNDASFLHAACHAVRD